MNMFHLKRNNRFSLLRKIHLYIIILYNKLIFKKQSFSVVHCKIWAIQIAYHKFASGKSSYKYFFSRLCL